MTMNLYKRTRKTIQKTQVHILAGGFFITLLVAAVYLIKPADFNILELKLYDVMLFQTHSPARADAVVIVDIDDQSLEKLGQWPWPRYRVARLLDKINTAGPRAVGLDILFAEPDRTSPMVMKQALKRDLDVAIQFSGIPNALLDNDTLMADVLKKGNFVLGFSGIFSGKKTEQPPAIIPEFKALQIREPGAEPARHYLPAAGSLISPLPGLLNRARGSGFMNTIPDQDGVIRRTPLLIS